MRQKCKLTVEIRSKWNNLADEKRRWADEKAGEGRRQAEREANQERIIKLFPIKLRLEKR